MSNNSDRPRRKVIIGKKQNLHLNPNVSSTLDSAINAVSKEITNLNGKIAKGEKLTAGESKQLNEYIRTLLSISKEAREREKHDALGDLSYDDLLNLASEAGLHLEEGTVDITPNKDES